MSPRILTSIFRRTQAGYISVKGQHKSELASASKYFGQILQVYTQYAIGTSSSTALSRSSNMLSVLPRRTTAHTEFPPSSFLTTVTYYLLDIKIMLGEKKMKKHKEKAQQNKNQKQLDHTLTPPISSTDTESTYPKSSGFGGPSFNCFQN